MKHVYGHGQGYRLTAFLLAVMLLLQGSAAAAAEKTDAYSAAVESGVSGGEESEGMEDFSPTDQGTGKYKEYCSVHQEAAQPQADYRLTAAEALVDGAAVLQDGRIRIIGEAQATWTVQIAEKGLYRMAVRYAYTDDSSVVNTQLGVRMNDAIPFQEAAALELKRWWRDADEIVPNAAGNDRKPRQEQVSLYTEGDLTDLSGSVREYLFFLDEGENRVTLQFDSGNLDVEALRIYNEEVPDYETYSLELGQMPHGGRDYRKIIQAETSLYKNDSSLTAARDRSGPATMPSDPVKLKLNVIDSSTYKKPGQILAWELDIPEDGFYKIGLRARQNDVEGLFVTRRITIDGKLPFEECGNVQFAYADKWAYTQLGGETAQLIYLKAGKHVLEMEAVSGASGKIAAKLEDAVFSLNFLYRKIIMITSTDPDYYRDYSLDKEIPELIPGFRELIGELNEILDELKAITGQKGGQLSVLSQLVYQLEDFIQDPVTITDRLESYKSNVSNVAALMLTLQQQPLDVDYLTVLGEDQEMGRTECGFFENLAYNWQAFIGSFFNDYVTFGSEDGVGKEQVSVWFSGGREQAEIIQQIIENRFIPESEIRVNLALVQIPLTQAILAGRAPDVVLNAARGQPVNLAARTALADLSGFEGFDKIREQFLPDALIPYTYKGGVYGIPVTMDFHVMFYRTDVLEELGIRPPETWEELYEIIPVIQRSNMTVGLPYTVMSSQTTIDSGLGAKDLFPTLLMQKGGSFYNEDRTALALDSAAAIEAFKEWTEFYNQYGFDLEYSFYNRFRTGEMPIGIQNYTMYNQLKAAAPEIKGLWDMTLVPGTRREDGTVDHTEAASGTAAVMLRDAENPQAAWKFMQWWCGSEAQAAYGTELELLMGEASRYNAANLEAMMTLPWSSAQLDLLKRQMSFITEVPEVVGSYYTSRGVDNAFRNVLFNSENYKEALMEQVETVNEELIRKADEFKDL